MKASPLREATSLAIILVFGLISPSAELTGGTITKQQGAPGSQNPAVPRPLPISENQPTHLKIDHDPLVCVTTVKAPVVAAKIQPGPELSKSYVFFREPGDEYFYYAVMQGPVPDVQGVLPRPMPEVKSVEYFVQAMDTNSLSRKTPDYDPPVVKADVCRDNGLAVGAAGAGLTIGLTNEKQSPYPKGFNKSDIAKVILVTGAVVGIAAAAAAASGSAAAGGGAAAGAATGTGAGAAGGAGAAAGASAGLSTGVIVAGGAVVAAGAGVGISHALNNASSTPTPSNTPTRTPTWTPVPNAFLEIDATWSGVGGVTVELSPSGGGTPIPGPPPCGTGSKTARFIVQGPQNVVPGSYQVTLRGQTCPGTPTPPTIAAFVSVQSSMSVTQSNPACGKILSVPSTGQTSCAFTIP